MGNVQTNFRRLKRNLSNNFPLLNFLFIVAIIFFATCVWGTISSVTRNWELEQRVASKEKEKEIIELEVESIELENRYYSSEEYQELAARAKQNKMKEGETLVYLPKNTVAAKTKHTGTNANQELINSKEDTRSNFEQWMTFLFGI